MRPAFAARDAVCVQRVQCSLRSLRAMHRVPARASRSPPSRIRCTAFWALQQKKAGHAHFLECESMSARLFTQQSIYTIYRAALPASTAISPSKAQNQRPKGQIQRPMGQIQPAMGKSNPQWTKTSAQETRLTVQSPIIPNASPKKSASKPTSPSTSQRAIEIKSQRNRESKSEGAGKAERDRGSKRRSPEARVPTKHQ